MIKSNQPPLPPTNCCMESCANCVWIQYCQELMDYYQDGGQKAKVEIERLVNDPTLKIFLKMEIENKLKLN